MTRHQLYDPPVPWDEASSIRDSVISQPFSAKRPTVKFGSQDVVHSYQRPGTGDNTATHEHRRAHGSTLHDNYPPSSFVQGNDIEPTTLFPTSPIMSRQSTFPQVIPRIPPPQANQVLNIPPSLAIEHTVKSAPAAIGRAPTTTKGGLFDSISGKETLLSFPSVTDSAPSEWGAVDVDKEDKESQNVKKEKPKIPMKSPKRYPRGLADDDKEESMTLFRKEMMSAEGHDDSSSTTPTDISGIRLVSINQRDYF